MAPPGATVAAPGVPASRVQACEGKRRGRRGLTLATRGGREEEPKARGQQAGPAAGGDASQQCSAWRPAAMRPDRAAPWKSRPCSQRPASVGEVVIELEGKGMLGAGGVAPHGSARRIHRVDFSAPSFERLLLFFFSFLLMSLVTSRHSPSHTLRAYLANRPPQLFLVFTSLCGEE